MFYSCNLLKKSPKIILDKNNLNGFFIEKTDGTKFILYKDTISFYIDTLVVLKFSDFDVIEKKKSKYGDYNLYFSIKNENKELLLNITKEQKGNNIFLIINDKLISAPIIQEEISGGEIVITGLEERFIDEILNSIYK